MKATHILVIIAVLLLAGCSSAKDVMEETPIAPVESTPVAPEEIAPQEPVEVPVEEAKPAGPEELIVLGDRSAEPGDVTIGVGGSVTFRNDAETRPHIILIDSMGERSIRMASGDSHTFEFPESGEYDYRDLWIGSLRGTIIVE